MRLSRQDSARPNRSLPRIGAVLALSAALAVCLGGLGGCGAIQGALGPSGTGSSSGASSLWLADANPDIVPTDRNFDADAFQTICDEAVAAATNGSADDALARYDEAVSQLGSLITKESSAYIAYCEDVEDEALETAYATLADTQVDCSDAFCVAAHELATGPVAETFRTHVDNEELFAEYVDYEAMSQEEKDLCQRETDLVGDYYSLMSDTSSCTYEYDGHTYTLDALSSEMAVVMLGEEGYIEAYTGCMKALNAEAGKIFLELVSVRNRIAQMNGYDDYCTYADEEIYLRDYTEDDLAAFRSAIQGFSSSGLVPDTYDLAYELPSYSVSATQLLKDVSAGISTVSSYATDALAYLQSNGLASLGSDETRMDAGFTAQLYYPVRSAFIYDCLYGNVYDLTGFVHELGHFTRETNHEENAVESIFETECNDVSEIHSTGLELLAGCNFASVLGEDDASLFSAWLAGTALDCICDGGVYDEWQRTVYRNPGMTLDEVNSAFAETLSAYGLDNSDMSVYAWVQVQHNFDSPLYYISYATSYFATLQLWQMAQTGTDGAAKAASIWESAIDAPADTGYLEFCSDAGLARMSDTAAVKAVLDDVAAQIDALIAESGLATAA